jgi:hypothetical protein
MADTVVLITPRIIAKPMMNRYTGKICTTPGRTAAVRLVQTAAVHPLLTHVPRKPAK